MFRKQLINYTFFGVGFIGVMLGMMFMYGQRTSDIQDVKGTSVEKVVDKVVIPSDTSNASSSTGSIKTDNPPAGVVPDVANLPATANDYYQLGLENFSKNKWDQAIVEFTEAINLDGTDPNYYLKKSEAEYKLNKKDQAVETINAGLQKVPGNSLLQDQLDILNSL